MNLIKLENEENKTVPRIRICKVSIPKCDFTNGETNEDLHHENENQSQGNTTTEIDKSEEFDNADENKSNSENESEYEPSDSDESEADSLIDQTENTQKTHNSTTEFNSDISKDASLVLHASFNVPGNSACDDKELVTELSRGPKGGQKKNCCIYCQQLQSKIARHLELKHHDEAPVAMFCSLPKGSRERLNKIALLRKKGNFLYNVQKGENEKQLIPVRRPRVENKRGGVNFTACPNCKGFYTKNNIRHHFQVCANKTSNSRNVLTLARRTIGRVHERASQVMRDLVIPPMFEDDITCLIRYDLLLILYGNKLCVKYRQQYLYTMIRGYLRLLGRFLRELKKIETEITDFASIYDPKYYNKVLDAVNVVAGLDERNGLYNKPSNALSLGMHISKIGLILIAEYIKSHQLEKKQNVKNFLKLYEEDYSSSINKTAMESQIKNKRQKKVQLPKTKDIKCLSNFVDAKMNEHYKSLSREFSIEKWRALAEATLINIQIFNRKRAGELERLLISDFKNIQSITEDDEDYKSLSSADKRSANKYVRVEIRGKLNRPVPILMDTKMHKSAELILKYRKKAAVPSKNPYVFGIKGRDSKIHSFLRATILMRQFSNQCGAKKPETLRGTILRKHMATKCSELHLNEGEISNVANFMGHHVDIHKNIYRQKKSQDILQVSAYLEKARGNDSINDINSSMENSSANTTTTENINLTTSEANSSTSFHSEDNEQTSLDDNGNNNFKKTCQNNSTLSSSESDEEFDENSGQTNYSTCSAKRNKISRRRWSREEIEAAQQYFGDNIKSRTLPSLITIRKLQKEKHILQNRLPPVVKTWLHNEMKKMKRNAIHSNEKVKEKGTKDNTAKRKINKYIEYIFADHISKNRVPTLKECKTAQNCQVLNKISVDYIQKIAIKRIQKPSRKGI